MDTLSRQLLSVHSAVAPGLAALGDWLIDAHYGHEATERILDHTEREGTPTGAPDLDREDEWAATEVFVAGLADIPMASPCWDDPTAIIDVELYLNGVHPTPFPEPPADELLSLAAHGLAPIAGGSPEGDEPVEPSPEDWADYAAWSRGLEERRAAAELEGRARAWYRRHPISEFNAVRPD